MVGRIVKRSAIMAVAVPVAAAGARKLGHTIESRRGPSRKSRMLHKGADILHRVTGRPAKRADILHRVTGRGAKRRRWF